MSEGKQNKREIILGGGFEAYLRSSVYVIDSQTPVEDQLWISFKDELQKLKNSSTYDTKDVVDLIEQLNEQLKNRIRHFVVNELFKNEKW